MNENSQENSSPASPPNAGPDVKIADGANIEDMKQSVKVIEGMFHAVNNATFKLIDYQNMMMGMTFLKAIHDGIIKQLGPEEIAKIRAAEAFKAAPVGQGAA